MRIFISCIPFDGGKSGISVYIRNVVRELAAAGHELTLLVEPGGDVFFPNHHTVSAPGWTRRAVLSMLWHLIFLPFRLSRKKYDLCLLTAANRRALAFYPLFTVAVVHDLAQYHVPGKYDALRMFYLKRVLPFFVRRAPAVLAISHSTAKDLAHFWRVPEEKIKVIPNGLSLPAATNAAQNWAARHGLAGEMYILYISRIESPGKNHLNLLRAYELLPEALIARYRLVIAGADWHGSEAVHRAAEASKYRDRIVFTGFLPVEDMEEAYKGAACYVFPSLFEGFGLSLIEAMHYGTPCACSNNSSLGEIGDGAALLFDPAKPGEITEAIARILESPKLAEELVAAGKERVKQFSWRTHASRITEWCDENSAANATAVLFGIPIDRVTTEQALERIVELAQTPRRERCKILATMNVDFLVNALPVWFHRGTPTLFPILQNADFVCADGMPLVAIGRLADCPLPERVTGADLVPLIAERAAALGLRLYFLGGMPEQTQTAVRILRERFPALQVAGVDTPFVTLDDSDSTRANDAEICEKINAARPDLLLVAFGNPKQELWVARNAEQLNVAAAIGIGGSLNFLCGAVRRAPRWMQRCGMEWIYRIMQEPGRLAKRYGVGLIKFGWLAAPLLAATWFGRCLCNRRSATFAVTATAVEVDCRGVRRLNNRERQTLLAARQAATRHRLPLRYHKVPLPLRPQLKAHHLRDDKN